MTALRVLFVEDTPDDAELLLHELRRGGFEPVHLRVETAAELDAALAEDWQIAIVDYELPSFSGSAALAILRERRPDLPVIAASGVVGEDTVVEMMRGGAGDYVLKDNLTRFIPVVERELRDAETRRERTRVEADLALAQERLGELAAIIDRSPAVAFVRGPEPGSPIRFASSSVARFGYSARKLVESGRRFDELIHQDDLSRVKREEAELIAAGASEYSQKYRLVTAAGETRWVEDWTWVRRDAAGEVVDHRAVVLDVTDREAATEAAGRERRYSVEVIEALPVFYVAIAADGTTLQMNREMLTALGYEYDEIVGVDYAQTFVPEGEREVVAGTLAALFEGDRETTTLSENHVLTMDGRELLAEWRGRTVIGPDGGVAFAVGLGIDVTERRAVEAALRAGEARYRGLFESAPVGLWEEEYVEALAMIRELGLSADGVADEAVVDRSLLQRLFDAVPVLGVNRAMVALLGARDDEEMMRHWDLLSFDSTFVAFRAVLVSLMRGESSASYEDLTHTVKGDAIPTLESFSVIENTASSVRLLFSNVPLNGAA